MITVSEESRRMQDMMKMYSMYMAAVPTCSRRRRHLSLNANNGLVKYALNNKDGEKTPMLCEQPL